MFTGLVQAKGTVIAAENGRFTIACPWEADSIALGASICCDGCCLSVTGVEPMQSGAQFKIDVSNETLEQDDARRLVRRPQHQPRKIASRGRRTRRPPCLGACRWRRPYREHRAVRLFKGYSGALAARSREIPCGERLGCARRRFTYCERGFWLPLHDQPHSNNARCHHMG